MDLRVFNVIIIKLSCVEDVSFRDDLPVVISDVFDVPGVSGIDPVDMRVSGVTPPDEGR